MNNKKKVIKLNDFLNLHKIKKTSTKIFINNKKLVNRNMNKVYITVDEIRVWDIKKAIFNILKIGVSKQIISYKNVILNNKMYTHKYDYTVLEIKK